MLDSTTESRDQLLPVLSHVDLCCNFSFNEKDGLAIANGKCVSFCNQPKAQFGQLRRVTPVCRCIHPFCGWRHLATSRELDTFWPPWVRSWDNRGKCYMDGKRIQCLSNALQHVPIYLQPFSSKSTRKFKSSPFQHIFAHILASPGYDPGTGAVNVTWMERGFNVGQMLISSTVYELQRDIGRKLQLFPTPLHLTPPLGVFPLEFRVKVWTSESQNHGATRQ